jgi:hypothetical protein
MAKDKKSEPFYKTRKGSVEGAIFKNEQKSKRTKKMYTSYSTNIVRSYYDDDKEEWVQTNYFYEKDLQDLVLVGNRCLNAICDDRDSSGNKEDDD